VAGSTSSLVQVTTKSSSETGPDTDR
jgi:hypothetical protein